MSRPGVTVERIVAVAAEIVDEFGLDALTLALIAERLDVSAPSLYKHVASVAEVQHRRATRATNELGDRSRDAMPGKSGRDALAALAFVTRSNVAMQPGRYAATLGAHREGPQDPLMRASTRVIETISAVLNGYSIPEEELVHAIRTVRCALHGDAVLATAGGFQWSDDAERSLESMIAFNDRGLSR